MPFRAVVDGCEFWQENFAGARRMLIAKLFWYAALPFDMKTFAFWFPPVRLWQSALFAIQSSSGWDWLFAILPVLLRIKLFIYLPKQTAKLHYPCGLKYDCHARSSSYNCFRSFVFDQHCWSGLQSIDLFARLSPTPTSTCKISKLDSTSKCDSTSDSDPHQSVVIGWPFLTLMYFLIIISPIFCYIGWSTK